MQHLKCKLAKIAKKTSRATKKIHFFSTHFNMGKKGFTDAISDA